MQPPDFGTMQYRMESLEKRFTTLADQIEKQLATFQVQLQRYVPARENELQLSAIQTTVGGIKDDVSEIKKEMNDITQKVIAQDKNQDKSKIRQLWYVVSTVISLIVVILG